MDRLFRFLSIFLVNILFVFLYIAYFSLPLSIDQLPDQFCTTEWALCFLPDIKQYASNHELLTDLDFFYGNILRDNGGTSIHMYVYWFVNPSQILVASILFNSIVVAIVLTRAVPNFVNMITVYLVLCPYFVFYSYGPTKELISVLGVYFLLTVRDGKWRFLLFLLLLLVRPLYAIVYLIFRYVGFSLRKFSLVLLIFSISIPLLYKEGVIFFGLVAEPSKFSQVLDGLRYETLLLSVVGFIVAALKNIAEPFIYVTKYGFSNVILTSTLVVYFVSFIEALRNYLKLTDVLTYSLITLTVVAWYPIVQSRYLAVPLIVLILLSHEKTRKYSRKSLFSKKRLFICKSSHTEVTSTI